MLSLSSGVSVRTEHHSTLYPASEAHHSSSTPETLTVFGVSEGSRVQKVSYTHPHAHPGRSYPNLFPPSSAQFLEVLLSLDNPISLLHESTFNKSSQWVLFFLCLATFTSGPATQKPLLTSHSKEKRLGCYLGKW